MEVDHRSRPTITPKRARGVQPLFGVLGVWILQRSQRQLADPRLQLENRDTQRLLTIRHNPKAPTGAHNRLGVMITAGGDTVGKRHRGCGTIWIGGAL